MGEECTMLEISKLLMDKEEEDDEIEMSLELSIGGSYVKSTKNPKKLGKEEENNINSDLFSFDLEKRKEIQAVRRREARMELKNSNNLGFFVEVNDDDKLLLEAKRFQSRAEDREMRENEDCELSSRKNDDLKLNLSLCTKNNNNNNNNAVQGLYPKVQCGYAYPAASWIKKADNSNGAYNQNGKSFLEYDDSKETNNGPLEQSSSPSDYQSKGGSNSYSFGPRQLHNFPRKNRFNQPEVNSDSFGPKATSSSSFPLETSNGLVDKPPKPPNDNLNATSTSRTPRVTTTGNCPNGKTINGILYQYTKTEVRIMCVCHGNSFSPAGFVEHAGSINISNPLRHITIVPPR